MRKFLSPIINIVSLILVGIAFGLGALLAGKVNDVANMGSYYELVWINKPLIGIIGFFLICVGAIAILAVFCPKGRKCTATTAGLLLIAGGVLALLTPNAVQADSPLAAVNQPGLIGMAVLLFIAGGFSLIITVIEFIFKD